MIKVTPLFSGSKGNCTLIQTEQHNILIDLGYKYQCILQSLSNFNLCPNDITAIVITHSHTDHVSALSMWNKHCNTKVYIPTEIAESVASTSYCTNVVHIDGSFNVGDVNVDVYECSHDVVRCCGYRFNDGNDSFAIVTDTGCINDKLVDFLRPCRTVMLESNHDVDMLKRGPYSYVLKRRILSDYGHLSNSQTAILLQKIANFNIKNVILAHLSENNNTKELAFNCAVNALKAVGKTEGKDITVYVANQYVNGETI